MYAASGCFDLWTQLKHEFMYRY